MLDVKIKQSIMTETCSGSYTLKLDSNTLLIPVLLISCCVDGDRHCAQQDAQNKSKHNSGR
jgi:hypothetical protein